MKKYFYFFTFLLMVFSFYIKHPLIIEFENNPNIEPKLYYSIDKNINSFSERYALVAEPSNNKIILNLPILFDRTMRLDFANQPFNITIKSIYIKVLMLKFHFSVNNITPLYQIGEIKSLNQSIIINSVSNATDPQLQLTGVPKNKILLFKTLIVLFLSLFICYVTYLFQNKSKNYFIVCEQKLHMGYIYVVQNLRDFRSIIYFYFTAIVLNIYSISSYFITIDDELNGTGFNPPSIWIADGRWTNYLLQEYMFKQPVLPFFTATISLLFMSISYYFMLKIFDLKPNFKTYLAFPVYIFFPSLYFINEFYANMIPISLGYLFASLSMYLMVLVTQVKSNRKILIMTSAALMALSVGTYQSFILLYISMYIGLIVWNSDKTNHKLFIFNSSIGMFIYLLVDKIMKFLFPSTRLYIDSFIKFSELLRNPMESFLNIFQTILNFYFDTQSFFGIELIGFTIVVLLFLLYIILQKNNLKIYYALAILLTPFLLNFISNNFMPIRAMVALPFVAWFITLYILEYSKTYLTKITSYTIVMIFIIQVLYVNANYTKITYIVNEYDKRTATELYFKMANTNTNFNTESTHKVHFFGSFNNSEIVTHGKLPSNGASLPTGESFFAHNKASPTRIIKFMEMLGYGKIEYAQLDGNIDIKKIYNNMSIWPASNSVFFTNNIYFIKLGNSQ